MSDYPYGFDETTIKAEAVDEDDAIYDDQVVDEDGVVRFTPEEVQEMEGKGLLGAPAGQDPAQPLTISAPAPGSGLTDEQVAGALEVPGPVNLHTLTSEKYLARIKEITPFVATIKGLYAWSNSVIPACWDQHPQLVNVLSAMHTHWQIAFLPTQVGSAALDHVLTVARCEELLRALTSACPCTADHHESIAVSEFTREASGVGFSWD